VSTSELFYLGHPTTQLYSSLETEEKKMSLEDKLGEGLGVRKVQQKVFVSEDLNTCVIPLKISYSKLIRFTMIRDQDFLDNFKSLRTIITNMDCLHETVLVAEVVTVSVTTLSVTRMVILGLQTLKPISNQTL